MQRDVTRMRILLVALFAIVTGLALEGPAFAQVDAKEVLILDFTGHWDKGSKHVQTFQETVLPDADAVSIGIHGVIPDSWRQGVGYDTIIRAGSARDYKRSVNEVYNLIKQDRTILGFDINEGIKAGSIPIVPLPEQLREGQPMAPNKIHHPAMVAARVAERWLQEHPDGLLILRGHSDGTYAERYIFDYLKEKGMAPEAVILESPRQVYEGWAKRAQATPETLFLSITSAADFPRESIIDRGYANVPSNNWVNLHVQGLRDPLSAHSIVTDYRNLGLKIQRTDASGRTFTENVSLGNLVAKELSNLPPPSKPGSLDPSVVHRDLPPVDERKKIFPIDPWDKGGGAAGTLAIPQAPRPSEAQSGVAIIRGSLDVKDESIPVNPDLEKIRDGVTVQCLPEQTLCRDVPLPGGGDEQD